jgi:predicted DNA binding protein
MKTPLMELIDWIQREEKIFPFYKRLDPEYQITAKATELLEKEREVIQDAFDEGFVNRPHSTYIGKVITASDYYTKTFTNESE